MVTYLVNPISYCQNILDQTKQIKDVRKQNKNIEGETHENYTSKPLWYLYHKRYGQKYSRLRCLLRVKGLVIGFYLGWSGSILWFRKI